MQWLSTLLYTAIVSATTFPVKEIYHFPNSSWAENFAVRSNGALLVTRLDVPELYQVDPFGKYEPILIYTFPKALGLLGITEFKKDVFALVSTNYSIASGTPTVGSTSVWTVDFKPSVYSKPVISINHITSVADAVLPNGMVSLGNGRDVLFADSIGGVVYRVNTWTGQHAVIIDDPLFKLPPAGGIGVNGIHIKGSSLYFTNTYSYVFGKVSINMDGTPKGAASVVSSAAKHGDDFSFDMHGNAYVAQNSLNTVSRFSLTPNGTVTAIAGGINSSVVAGCTATNFGRTVFDKNILYVTTNGRVPAGGIPGGRVLAIDLTKA